MFGRALIYLSISYYEASDNILVLKCANSLDLSEEDRCGPGKRQNK